MQRAEFQTVEQWYDERAEQAEKEFFDFLKIPSISTDPKFALHIAEAADFVQNYIEKHIGMEVQRWTTSGHPTLFAQDLSAGKDKPTVLIYNHYDVQPVDPLELWQSPPFEPQIRDGKVFARGAQDNKGQCFYVLQALRAFKELHGKFPLNVKLCIEGEEECGSGGLFGILEAKKQELKADSLLVVDLGIPAADQPAITLGVRGMAVLSVEVQCSTGDLHSGFHGGMVYNPLHALVEMLAKLRDDQGRILVPGFYDDVAEVSPQELELLDFPMTEEQYQKLTGALPTGGEKSVPFMHRSTLRPTLEINGIAGGYGGVGFKSVIPAKAVAKVSCRLVPNQDPKKIADSVAAFLKGVAPQGTQVTIQIRGEGGRAVRVPPHSAAAQAFSKAYEEIFQKPCLNVLSGGSIPVVAKMAQVTGAEVLLMGLGLAEDDIHAPNENFSMGRVRQGTCLMFRGLELMGAS